MAKQKLQAGAELDILTATEMRSLLREWMVDVARGCRPVKIASQGTANAAGLVSVGGTITPTGGTLGPNPGFWWAVMRLAVRVDGAAAGAFTIFSNEAIPHSLVRDVPASAGGFASFSDQALLVPGGDQLLVQVTSSAPSTGVATVTGAAMEIPEQLMWKWTVG